LTQQPDYLFNIGEEIEAGGEVACEEAARKAKVRVD
jgi:hypothetical protein